MIYLIDDNQYSQRERFLSNIKTEKYSLKIIPKIPKTKDIAFIEHLNFLNDAECILLHKSIEDVDEDGNYISGSTTNADKIIEDISQLVKKFL
ncbi:MAG: hypothetical protein U5K72_16035 [Balneolaceae bacterium]|nr:hypothetical protein [Balneolaceae bacterium]